MHIHTHSIVVTLVFLSWFVWPVENCWLWNQHISWPDIIVSLLQYVSSKPDGQLSYSSIHRLVHVCTMTEQTGMCKNVIHTKIEIIYHNVTIPLQAIIMHKNSIKNFEVSLNINLWNTGSNGIGRFLFQLLSTGTCWKLRLKTPPLGVINVQISWEKQFTPITDNTDKPVQGDKSSDADFQCYFILVVILKGWPVCASEKQKQSCPWKRNEKCKEIQYYIKDKSQISACFSQ